MPHELSFENTVLEIDSENQEYLISANAELMVNVRKCFFSQIKTHDLIFFRDTFIVFNEALSNPHDTDVFIGHFNENQENLFVFKLPEKVSDQSFEDIRKSIGHDHQGPPKLYIDCQSVLYMDSKAINGMMALIQDMKNEKNEICFYAPSYKFRTYLELANIDRLVPLKTKSDAWVDHLIREKPMGQGCKIANDSEEHHIGRERLISIGRQNSKCDISLSDPSVSRVHAVMIHMNGELYVVDCGSTNFSYVNHRKIMPYCLNPLKINDIVVFGHDTYFKIRPGDQSPG